MFVSHKTHAETVARMNKTIDGKDKVILKLENEKEMSKEKYELKEKKAVAALEDRLAKETTKLEKEGVLY